MDNKNIDAVINTLLFEQGEVALRTKVKAFLNYEKVISSAVNLIDTNKVKIDNIKKFIQEEFDSFLTFINGINKTYNTEYSVRSKYSYTFGKHTSFKIKDENGKYIEFCISDGNIKSIEDEICNIDLLVSLAKFVGDNTSFIEKYDKSKCVIDKDLNHTDINMFRDRNKTIRDMVMYLNNDTFEVGDTFTIGDLNDCYVFNRFVDTLGNDMSKLIPNEVQRDLLDIYNWGGRKPTFRSMDRHEKSKGRRLRMIVTNVNSKHIALNLILETSMNNGLKTEIADITLSKRTFKRLMVLSCSHISTNRVIDYTIDEFNEYIDNADGKIIDAITNNDINFYLDVSQIKNVNSINMLYEFDNF